MVASSSASGNNVASISATMESVTAGTKNVRVIATMPSGQSFEVDGVGGGGVGGNVDVMPATNDGDDANFASDVIDGEIIEGVFRRRQERRRIDARTRRHRKTSS